MVETVHCTVSTRMQSTMFLQHLQLPSTASPFWKSDGRLRGLITAAGHWPIRTEDGKTHGAMVETVHCTVSTESVWHFLKKNIEKDKTSSFYIDFCRIIAKLLQYLTI